MMDFVAGHSEAEKKDWERAFIDYSMCLICANEPMDCSGFRTSLGAVFALLPLRGNKAGEQAGCGRVENYSRGL